MHVSLKALTSLSIALAATTGLAAQNNSKLSHMPEKMKQKLHITTAANQRSTRSSDNAWNTSDGWNLWELSLVAYPTELLFEIYGEGYLEELYEQEIHPTAALQEAFPDGWFKTFSGRTIVTKVHEDAVLNQDGDITSSDLYCTDSVVFKDTEITSVLTYTDAVYPVQFDFNSSGKPLNVTIFDNTDADEQVIYTYENNRVSEMAYRETDYDAGQIDAIYQERYTFQYNNDTISAAVSFEEILDASETVLDQGKDDSVSYSFDNSGHILKRVEYTFDADGNAKASNQTLYTYNSQDQLHTVTDYTWDDTAGSWGHSSYDDSTIYTFDSNNRISSIFEYTYSSFYPYDSATNKFIKDDSTLYTYDSRGNVIEELAYKYNYSGKEWNRYDSSYYTYDINNNIIAFGWDGTSHSTVQYENGEPVRIVQIGDTTTEVTEIVFSGSSPIAEGNHSIAMAPRMNMQGKDLIITGLTNSIPELSLFTVQGRKIASLKGREVNGSVSFSLEGYANGIYFVRMKNEDISAKISLK